MNDALLWTFMIGGGLLVSGYSLGRVKGCMDGAQDTMNELFRARLIDPEKVLAHYSKEGNVKAMALQARIKEAKRNQEKNND